MQSEFKYKSAQLVARVNDPEAAHGSRQAELEKLCGPRLPYDPDGPPRSNIRGCPHVGSMTTEELREEIIELRAAGRVPVPPKLTPTGRMAKHQGPKFEVRNGTIGHVRSGEIRAELQRRGENPDAA